MWGYHDGFGWWMVFGAVWMVLFWGAIIWLIFFLIRSLSNRPHSGSEDDAEAVARRRFASGEISEEEYHRILRTLRS